MHAFTIPVDLTLLLGRRNVGHTASKKQVSESHSSGLHIAVTMAEIAVSPATTHPITRMALSEDEVMNCFVTVSATAERAGALVHTQPTAKERERRFGHRHATQVQPTHARAMGN